MQMNLPSVGRLLQVPPHSGRGWWSRDLCIQGAGDPHGTHTGHSVA